MNQETKNLEVNVSHRNTLGVISVVLGIVAIIGSWIPFLNVISIIIAICGILTGICSFISFLMKKSTNCILAIVGTLLSVLAASLAWNINNAVSDGIKDDGSPSKISDSSNNTSEANNSQQETTTEEAPGVYNVGDVISFDNKEVTATKVEKNYNTGNEYIKPKSGKKFIKVSVKIENKSNNDISVSCYDFKVQDSNGVINTCSSETWSLDDRLDSTNLAPNGKIAGSIIFEVPSNDSDLKLIYTPSFFLNKKIEIKL